MNQRTKIDDVARMAGVSPRTVSRVINGLPNVSRKAREAIEAAIADLDYRPDFAARALASSRSFFIGVIGPPISSDYFSGLHAALIAACRERGLHAVIEQVSRDGDPVAEQIGRIVRQIHFAGIVMMSLDDHVQPAVAIAKSAGVPMVAISSNPVIGQEKAIRAGEQQGEILLADHFWELGHRRFAVGRIAAAHFDRGKTFRRRLLELGADPAEIVDFPIDWHLPGLEAGRRLGAQILATSKRPTALFALNDEVAAGATGHFLSAGLSVPVDISVAGFDDSPIAQAIWPALTTIRQPVEAMAREAVSWLLEGSEAQPGVRTLPVDLVVRGSTADAPTG